MHLIGGYALSLTSRQISSSIPISNTSCESVKLIDPLSVEIWQSYVTEVNFFKFKEHCNYAHLYFFYYSATMKGLPILSSNEAVNTRVQKQPCESQIKGPEGKSMAVE